MSNVAPDSTSSLTIRQPMPRQQCTASTNALHLQPSLPEVFVPVMVEKPLSFNSLVHSANSFLESTPQNVLILMKHNNSLTQCNVNSMSNAANILRPAVNIRLSESTRTVPVMTLCSENKSNTNSLTGMPITAELFPSQVSNKIPPNEQTESQYQSLYLQDSQQTEHDATKDNSQVDPLQIDVGFKSSQYITHSVIHENNTKHSGSESEDSNIHPGKSIKEETFTSTEISTEVTVTSDMNIAHDCDINFMEIEKIEEIQLKEITTRPLPVNEKSTIKTEIQYDNTVQTRIEMRNEECTPSASHSDQCIKIKMHNAPTSLSATVNPDALSNVITGSGNCDSSCIVENIFESTAQGISVTMEQNPFRLMRDSIANIGLSSRTQAQFNEIISKDIVKEVISSRTIDAKHMLVTVKRKSKDKHKHKFCCSQCPNSFQTSWGLAKHLAIHLNLNKFECGDCGNKYVAKRYLKEHIKRKHMMPQLLHNCTKCNKKCSSINTLIKHLNDMHEFAESEDNAENKKKGKCVTNQDYKKLGSTHLKVNNSSSTISCVICKAKFVDQATLIEHFNSDAHVDEDLKTQMRSKKTHKFNVKNNFLCCFCGKIFYKHFLLYSHEQLAHTNNRFNKTQCKFCHKWIRKASIKKHIQAMHSKKTLPCTICGKMCYSSSSLKQHVIKSHETQPTLKCPLCPKLYKKQSSIQVHLRTHTGETPFKCSYCPREFTLLWNCQQHERLHTGEKLYKCELCGKAFTHNVSKRNHMKYHKDEMEIVDDEK